MSNQEKATLANTVEIDDGKPAGRKWLSKAFNAVAKIGLGAVVGVGVKTAVLGAAATAAAPAAVIVAVAALAGGLSSLSASFAKHAYDNRQLVKSGKESVSYDWKKKGALAFGLGALGGGVFSYFSDNIGSALSDVIDYFKTTPDVSAVPAIDNIPQALVNPAPVAVVEPLAHVVVAPCLPDQIQTLVNATGTSDAVKDAALRACSENARVAAQGTKDLGYHLLNGIGIEKSPALGVEQLAKAAELGNIQAIRDMAYLQFHGTAGVQKNVELALEKMETVIHSDKTGLAKRLMDQWTDTSSTSAVSTADTSITDSAITDRLNIETPIRETVEPIPTPAPAAVTPPPAPVTLEPEPTPTIPTAASTQEGESCTAVFTKDSVEFHCPVNDTTLVVGDTIHITRPPMLAHP